MERKKCLYRQGKFLRGHAGYSGAAFTLAEVLITLGIIGIVAAMTLPALVGKYQKAQTVNQLKKIYSELNQALLIAQKDYGTLDSWDLLDFENANERGTFFGEKYLFPHIKTIKKCFPVSSDCWAEKMYTIDNKTVSSFVSDGRGAFISASGYSVLYWVHGTGNGGWFWVDTNGLLKKPNTFGKDIFPFIIAWGNAGSVRQTTESDCFKRLGIYPLGLDCSTASPSRDDIINGTIAGHPDYSTYKCKKGSGSNRAGAYCGALLIYDGWQMKDDYPW